MISHATTGVQPMLNMKIGKLDGTDIDQRTMPPVSQSTVIVTGGLDI